MGVFQNSYTPYTNFHELNLDWVIGTVKELDERVNGDLYEAIREVLADAFVDITYKSESKSIVFDLKIPDDKE